MDLDLSLFDRYRDLVGAAEHDRLREALRRPLPVTGWTNTRRIEPEALRARLARVGVEVVPLDWDTRGFRWASAVKPGTTLEYFAGLYNVQEEAAFLPVRLLDVQPGMRVLDLCAAPGNKTVQIALELEGQGTVVANDRSFGRMRAVRDVVDRMGLLNVVMTLHDGANYPTDAGLFDRVLADVPCSCEGTSRKNREILRELKGCDLGRQAGTQSALLRSAIRLCAPGGRIVYATCSLAPEENEVVVADVLAELAERGRVEARLVPARVEGFAGSPGLTAWQGRHFSEEMAHTLRVWPHQMDTGGFFVAVIELGPIIDSGPRVQ